jgi:hypothetical protein
VRPGDARSRPVPPSMRATAGMCVAFSTSPRAVAAIVAEAARAALNDAADESEGPAMDERRPCVMLRCRPVRALVLLASGVVARRQPFRQSSRPIPTTGAPGTSATARAEGTASRSVWPRRAATRRARGRVRSAAGAITRRTLSVPRRAPTPSLAPSRNSVSPASGGRFFWSVGSCSLRRAHGMPRVSLCDAPWHYQRRRRAQSRYLTKR